jgi:hypothetical protein
MFRFLLERVLDLSMDWSFCWMLKVLKQRDTSPGGIVLNIVFFGDGS